MARLIREPLLHFLLGGAALFALFGWIGETAESAPDHIIIGETTVARLVTSFQRTWMRPPTRQELDGLIDDFVIEEILYREALALGLDRDDLVVRRRLRQKMEFLNDGLVDLDDPSDEDLQTFLEDNPDSFTIPARFTMRQIFFEVAAGDRAAATLRSLQASAQHADSEDDATELGDATLLPARLVGASTSDIDKVFGNGFGAKVAEMTLGSWNGPVASGYGLHLIRVERKEPSTTPRLADIRSVVAREWSAERRAKGRERFYAKLRQRYRIEVRPPAVKAAVRAADTGQTTRPGGTTPDR